MPTIDELVSSVDEFEKQRRDVSISSAKKENPEESGKVYDLSSKKGLPFGYVKSNQDQFLKPEDFSPRVARYLQDRDKASIIHDDTDNLTWWETTANELKNLGNLFPATAHSISSAGYSVGASMLNLVSDAFTQSMSAMGIEYEDDSLDSDVFGFFGKHALNFAQMEKQAAQSLMPKDSVIPQPVWGGVSSALINLPAMGAAVLSRNPNVALGAMGGVTYGDSYLQAKESGLNDADAIVYAGNQAIAEVLTEKIPVGRLFKDLDINSGFLKTVAMQMATEIPTEQAATLWQDFNEWVVLNPDKTVAEFAAERPEAAVDTLISTIVATGLQTSVISGIDKLTREQEKTAVDQLIEKSTESKVNQRSKELFKQFLQEADDNLYLDAAEARAFAQDLKQDAAQEFIMNQIDEAESVGGDIVIPVSEFATNFADSENISLIKDHLRLSPDSPNQIDLQTDQVKQVSEILKIANENVELQKQSKQIFNEVKDQLIATGRLDKKTASISAEIIPAYVTSRAARSGLSVETIYQMMGLKVVGPDAQIQSGEILDQASKDGYEGSDMGEAMEWVRAKEKGLDMSIESRINRAKDLGFDFEDVKLHSSKTTFAGSGAEVAAKKYGVPVEHEFKAPAGGIYFGENLDADAIFANSEFGGTGQYVLRKGNVFDARFKSMGEAEKSKLKKIIEGQVDDNDIEDAAVRLGVSIEEADPFEVFTDGEFYHGYGRGAQDRVIKALFDDGYDTVVFEDSLSIGSGGVSTVVKSPKQIRSINAAFDPDYKDSPRLLAQGESEAYAPEELQFLESQGVMQGEPVSTESLQAQKDVTKMLVQSELESGNVTPDHAFRGTSIDEINAIASSGELQVGRDAEGVPGISAAKIGDGQSPVYGDGSGIIIPPEYVSDSGRAGEVLVDEAIDPRNLQYVVNGEVVSFDDLNKTFAQSAYHGTPHAFDKFSLEAMEWVRAKEKGLDMSKEARMQRAAEQGFDVENVIYSGTYGSSAIDIAGYGRPISEGDNRFGGMFGSFEKSVAKSHGDNIQKFVSKRHITDDEFRSLSYSDETIVDDVKRTLKEKKYEDITDDEAAELLEYMSGEKSIFKSDPEMGRDRLESILNKSEDAEIDWDFQGLKGEIAARRGFTSIGMTDEHGESVLVLPGARSINAAFDPDYKDSPRLLAQPAFHGTPHTFDKFSLEAIGTGEGMQAFGWGLYLAGKREVAEFYKKSVSYTDVVRQFRSALPDDASFDEVVEMAENGEFDKKKAKVIIELDKDNWLGFDYPSQAITAAFKELDNYDPSEGLRKAIEDYGNLYQAEIPEDNEVLSWDKKLDEQSNEVYEALKKSEYYDELANPVSSIDGEPTGVVPTGRQFYQSLSKKLGSDKAASEYLNGLGIPGLRFLAGTSRGKADGDYNYVIWDEDRVTIEAVNDELRQAQEFEQKNRGLISFLPKESIIQLTKVSDLSTFLHESGHLFLQMEGNIYNHPNANESIKADGDAILKWLGAESFDSITVDQHEQFARGFEKYLGEGRAPSIELQSVFRRFAAWLKQVYGSLKKLNVNVSDEMRDVFDRMLATDEQIDRMKGRFVPLFESAEDAGATKAEYQSYAEKSTPEAAKEALRAKLLKQLERQHKEWWKNESIPIAAKIKKQLLSDALYNAVDTIRNSDSKLDRDQVKAVLGTDKIPAKFRNLTVVNGQPIDEAAAIFGLSSGEDLVIQINENPSLGEAVKEKTHAVMVKRHGDALVDGTLEDLANEAAHNVEYGKKIAAELAFLSRKTKKPAIDRGAIKEYALSRIGKMPHKKIYPAQFRAAEVRAARKAAVAKSKGDFVEAQKFKQQELVNFYLAKEAQDAKDKAQKIRSRLKATQTKAFSSTKYDNETVNQAKVLISAFDFRKNNRESMELARARLSSIQNWIKSQNVNPESVTNYVEAEILGKLIPYDQMTVDDLRGVDDVVSSMLFGAKKAMELDSEAYKADIEAGKQWLDSHRIDTYKTEMDSDVPWVRVKTTINDLFSSLRKMESLVRQADGMEEQGWLWKKTIKPLLDASNKALDMRQSGFKELNKMFEGFEGAFNGMYDRKKFVLDSGEKVSFSYGARISMALNMGNEDNLAALVNQGVITSDSKPYMTSSDVNKIVSTLSDKDWDLVQGIWDYVDTYWKDISELEIKRSGAAPQKVKPREFVTPTGKKMRGGYYPLVGDPVFDPKQQDQDITTQAGMMREGGSARKSTKHGSTIERTGFGGKKIDFSINVLFNHIDGIIHDITHWEAVRDVDRVLRNPKIYSELNTSLGNSGARVLKDRLSEVAAGPQRINGLRGWNRAFRHARLASTYNALGYSIRTALMNTAGITTAIADMDAKTVAAGTLEYYGNIKTSDEMILSKSKFMANRGEVINRDIATIKANIRGNTTWNKFKENSFWLMTQTDKAITRPIWVAAYRKGETMFETDQEAVDYADRMVARTQGSGLDMDLSSVETRNELMKSLTVMYSAMNAIYNITTEQIKRKKAGKINAVELSAKMAWLLVVPAIMEMLIKGNDDEPEKDIPANVAFYTLGLIPIGRDAASSIQYGSVFPPPAVRLAMAPVELAKQAFNFSVEDGLEFDKLDKGLIRATTDVASWGLFPGGSQLTRTLGYIIKLNEGEIDEFSVYPFLVTGSEYEGLIGE